MTKLFFSVALVAATAASPALAQLAETQPAETMTRSVHYGDLDLTTANGIAQLDRRIGQAVSAVCGHVQNDRAFARSIGACRANAFAGTQKQRQLVLNGAGSNRPIRVTRAR